MYVKMIVSVLAVILAVASAGMVGGPVDADMNDQGAQDALQYAVAQYNRGSNDAFVSQVCEVIKVQKQLVSGLKYTFTVKMARTSCRKGGVEALCTIPKDPANALLPECKIVVWSQPWLNSIKVLENTCQ
ncbi:cystatin C (amyloid angiopathy and cerebral hemorrhage) [Triplophysa rosa]|uniref:Cystatin-like n=1 Tax=Triplophysa rosa TaxID=992332 RepID=A0A9W7WP85_TRIRA|nr:cystatin C (amyloid angiopathy and cerebral hemorrhage) [Triplophysa rosa]KAI7805824.1 putative cystatin-like [Triplophysa rosa]